MKDSISGARCVQARGRQSLLIYLQHGASKLVEDEVLGGQVIVTHGAKLPVNDLVLGQEEKEGKLTVGVRERRKSRRGRKDFEEEYSRNRCKNRSRSRGKIRSRVVLGV